MHKTDNFSSLYRSHCISSNDNPDILSGKRAFAGVGLLWKASSGDLISLLSIENDRIVGIQYAYPNSDNLYFLAVYLLSSNHSMEKFRDTLDLLWVICNSYSMQGIVTIMGDFNCHLGHLCGGHSISNPDDRGKLIHDLLTHFSHYLVNLDDRCTGPVETFRSDDCRHSSTVDFISLALSNSVIKASVFDWDAENLLDHIPVEVCISSSDSRPESG